MKTRASMVIPPRPTMLLWALLALAMVVLSYLLIVLSAALCVVGPVWAAGNENDPATVLFFLVGIAVAGALLWSLVPRRQPFHPPGALLLRGAHPRLFEELETIAALLNEPMPEEVYLIPRANAFVADVGGATGAKSYRIMGIGLSLVASVTVGELRALLVHEFAHYYTGDTRIGPWIDKACTAMERAARSLDPLKRRVPMSFMRALVHVIRWVLEKYWHLFLRAIRLVSRKQEYRADELACLAAGPEALISGLKKLHAADAAFPAYWDGEVLPLLEEGLRPPITEGFAAFLDAPGVSRQVREILERELAEARMEPYDTHPPLHDRFAAAGRFREPVEPFSSAEPACTLFGDLQAEEMRLLHPLRFSVAPEDMKPFPWDELATVQARRWRDVARECFRYFGEVTAETLPDALERVAEVGATIPDPPKRLLTPHERSDRAAGLLAAALSLAILEAGGRPTVVPGDCCFTCGDEQIRIQPLIAALISGEIRREDWLRRCEMLNLRAARLGEAPGAEVDAGESAGSE